MSDQTPSPYAGASFLSLLALLFIGLKLGGQIDWPWLWVLSPLWVPVVATLAVLAFLLLCWAYVVASDRFAK